MFPLIRRNTKLAETNILWTLLSYHICRYSHSVIHKGILHAKGHGREKDALMNIVMDLVSSEIIYVFWLWALLPLTYCLVAYSTPYLLSVRETRETYITKKKKKGTRVSASCTVFSHLDAEQMCPEWEHHIPIDITLDGIKPLFFIYKKEKRQKEEAERI